MNRSLGGLVLGLALASTGPARAHHGHTDAAPWDACRDHAVNDRCQWTDAKGAVYRGSCRSVSDRLICVRNQPIRRRTAGGVGECSTPD